MEKRREVRIGKIPVKGLLGLVFTLAFVIILLIAVPATRWLLLFSVPTGIVIALILRYWSRRTGRGF